MGLSSLQVKGGQQGSTRDSFRHPAFSSLNLYLVLLGPAISLHQQLTYWRAAAWPRQERKEHAGDDWLPLGSSDSS